MQPENLIKLKMEPKAEIESATSSLQVMRSAIWATSAFEMGGLFNPSATVEYHSLDKEGLTRKFDKSFTVKGYDNNSFLST